MACAVPPERKKPERERPKLTPALSFIDAILEGDRRAPRKQRHTAHRIWMRLRQEKPEIVVGESTVREYVRMRKHAMGLLGHEVFVPQSYQFGGEAQVDWYEIWAEFDGQPRQPVDLMRCHERSRSIDEVSSLLSRALALAKARAQERRDPAFERELQILAVLLCSYFTSPTPRGCLRGDRLGSIWPECGFATDLLHGVFAEGAYVTRMKAPATIKRPSWSCTNLAPP